MLIAAMVVNAQVEYSSRANSATGSLMFFTDVASYKSSVPNKSRFDIYVQVPYSSVSFLKDKDLFNASYNITITFFDGNKSNILLEKSWKEKLKANNFDETLSRTSYNTSYKSVDLIPAKYFIKVLVEDGNSSRAAVKESFVDIKDFSNPTAISDLILISEIRKDSTGESIVPNVSNFTTTKNTSLPFFFNAYSQEAKDIEFEYSLTNAQGDTTFKTTEIKKVDAGTTIVISSIKDISLYLGEYTLNIAIKDGQKDSKQNVKKNFFAKILGIPNSIVDLEKAVNQMAYIASSNELNFIKDAKSYEEKMNRFLSFWDSKKPNKDSDDNPIMYEYYRRVDYANKTFKGYNEGWKTDMGMIFITFGPPSNVARHPYEMNSKPYEVWEYYDLNRSFVFVDESGFGNYRLYNPDYSRWPGYRY